MKHMNLKTLFLKNTVDITIGAAIMTISEQLSNIVIGFSMGVAIVIGNFLVAYLKLKLDKVTDEIKKHTNDEVDALIDNATEEAKSKLDEGFSDLIDRHTKR